MFFLLTSADQILCSNVESNKVIAIEEPVQATNAGSQKNVRGKYRTRADKKFCSKECANETTIYERKADVTPTSYFTAVIVRVSEFSHGI
jgi:hypothetical protein